MPKVRKALKIVIWIVGIAAGIITVLYLSASLLIGWSVNRTSQMAMRRFKGDRDEALIAVVRLPDLQPS